MNILVFGGAGFIGTNLIRRLLDDSDNNVICVDNFYTSDSKNVNQFLNYSNYHFCNLDITRKSAYNTYNIITIEINNWFNGQLDQIYNLACPASPPKYQMNPLYTIRCSLAVDDMCKLALNYNAKILHTSTSEVYGDPDDRHHPQEESYRGNVTTIGPRSCYDEGKRIAETILYEYSKLGCKVKIVRVFNTYGPYMDPDDGRVVSNFICQALKNQDITIYGSGDQTRSFQYIDDLIDGMILMMNNTEDDFYGPCNIGSNFEFKIKELAMKVMTLVPNCTSKIVFKDLPTDDPTQRQANTNLICNKTGWVCKISLEDGLKKTIDYFKSVLKDD